MMQHAPLITALYAGLNGLLATILAIRVTMTRSRLNILAGDGGNAEMLQTIRTHANNAEYVPMALVLLGIIEIVGAPSLAVHVLGAALFAGCLLHAQGLVSTSGASFGRVAGTSLTWLVLILTGLYAIYLFAVGGRT